MIGWIILGAVAGALLITAIDRFWNDIANWLNNTAANAVEKVLGYDAKKFMHRAVATVTRVHEKLHNKTVVYTRQSALSTHIQKISLKKESSFYDEEQDVRELFEKECKQVNEFVYQK